MKYNKKSVFFSDSPNISEFTFYGTLIKKEWGINAGTFTKTVKDSKSFMWSFVYEDIPLTIGDSIEYTYFVTYNSNVYRSHRQIYFIRRKYRCLLDFLISTKNYKTKNQME